MKRLETFRDVLILQPEEAAAMLLVTAADSCGAIGEKPEDVVCATPEYAAALTARVTLLETACVGARAAFCTLNICNDPQYGERLISGVRKVISGTPMVISTEKNMPTCMSAFGVSITGTCAPGALRLGRSLAGDNLFCAGVPLVGEEVLRPGAECFTMAHLESLFRNPRVHAVIPCGSQGIAKETSVLAAESKLSAVLGDGRGLDLNKSAGPASCAVFTAGLPASYDFQLGLPVACIGYLANLPIG